MDGLIAAVVTSYQEMQMTKINSCFMTLQRCISEIIMVDGNNNYRILHMNKVCCLCANEPPENTGLTYLAQMHLRHREVAYASVCLFGSENLDLNLSDEDLVMEMKKVKEVQLHANRRLLWRMMTNLLKQLWFQSMQKKGEYLCNTEK